MMLATYMAISEISGAVKKENGGFVFLYGLLVDLGCHNSSYFRRRVLVFLSGLLVYQVSVPQCKLFSAPDSRVFNQRFRPQPAC